MKMRYLLLFIVGTIFSCYAKANNNIGPGIGDEKCKTDILGGVYTNDSKKPIYNVQVTAYMANKKEKSVSTDINGYFSFDDLKPGTYKLVFEKDGYHKVVKEKTISRINESFQINIQMEAHVSYDFGPSRFFDFE